MKTNHRPLLIVLAVSMAAPFLLHFIPISLWPMIPFGIGGCVLVWRHVRFNKEVKAFRKSLEEEDVRDVQGN